MHNTSPSAVFRAETGSGSAPVSAKPARNILGETWGSPGRDSAIGQNTAGWVPVGGKLKPHP